MSIKIETFEDPFILTFLKPLTVAEETFTSITLTEPTAGQVETASKAQTGATSNIVLVSLVAKVPEALVRKMGNRDFSRAVKYLENFI